MTNDGKELISLRKASDILSEAIAPNINLELTAELNYVTICKGYEEEQKELTERLKELKAKLEKFASQSVTADMFISTVRKYTRAKKLTQQMLNELIQKFEVFNAEKVEGVWQQRLIIHYNCIGSIEIPDVLTLPAPEVSVNTRKGVTVSYASETATA